MESNELLDKNGTFKVPFFHGTSSLFLPHIHRHGLGGLNMVQENGWVEGYRDLYDFARKTIGHLDDWPRIEIEYGLVAEQGISRDGNRHNYRHGETYVTPEERMAAKYALDAGCELLSYAKNLIHILQIKTYSLDCLNVLPEQLVEILGQQYRPLLVQIDGLSFHDIATENGDDKLETLDRYQEIRGTGQGAVDLTNWKLLKPVPVQQLSVWQA
ncbi:hypothetical protein [Marinobacter orientalis]|uniref:Uncharacterized protein n=1 Tax=Marinobacter orientalis TaxID=1928859 RepID=A0A7Y0NKD4_9GAMM|nr:hypothetical protein [Marinobacter orientalis]NMT62793.1 hypothetical protein [Marinobacter orientalis]TGX51472.1 hypothetical protein DIT72_05460 [Marinobacter orientalis]